MNAKLTKTGSKAGLIQLKRMGFLGADEMERMKHELERAIKLGNEKMKKWIFCRLHARHGHIEMFLIYSIAIIGCLAKGPHHPGGTMSKDRAEQKKHINQHLNIQYTRMYEELKQYTTPTNISVGLSDKEKKYLYFKSHDFDDNNKLDGLEMYYSITCRSQLNIALPRKDAPINISLSNEHGQALNENEESDGCDFDHIIEILDNFLKLADLNNDGFLDFAEYVEGIVEESGANIKEPIFKVNF